MQKYMNWYLFLKISETSNLIQLSRACLSYFYRLAVGELNLLDVLFVCPVKDSPAPRVVDTLDNRWHFTPPPVDIVMYKGLVSTLLVTSNCYLDSF